MIKGGHLEWMSAVVVSDNDLTTLSRFRYNIAGNGEYQNRAK